jgi:hypothetical protein
VLALPSVVIVSRPFRVAEPFCVRQIRSRAASPANHRRDRRPRTQELCHRQPGRVDPPGGPCGQPRTAGIQRGARPAARAGGSGGLDARARTGVEQTDTLVPLPARTPDVWKSASGISRDVWTRRPSRRDASPGGAPASRAVSGVSKIGKRLFRPARKCPK